MPSEKQFSPSPIPGLPPSPSLRALLQGSFGKAQRLRMATLALEMLAQEQHSASTSLPSLAPLASMPNVTPLSPLSPLSSSALSLDFLLAAFESDPADTGMAAQALRVGLKLGALSPEVKTLLGAAAAGAAVAPLTEWQDGLSAWRDGHMTEALEHFRRSGSVFTTPLECMGHCLAALGQRKEAIDIWRQVLRRRPWHMQLYLTLHDYLLGHDQPLAHIHGQTAALFYSWNKADDLHAALASLADKDGSLPDALALVACLDNGSTDATADVLRCWQERWGQRFVPVRLPVNIGAAAARNWLASLPEVRALPYAVYIDDDALLPSPTSSPASPASPASWDWLGHLGRAVHTYPHAAVWGCRIVDAHDPQHLQCGPLHMQPLFCLAPEVGGPLPGQPEPAKGTHADVAFSPLLAEGQPFRLTHHLCAGYDYGAYNYLRPCASVAGCCHLFRTEDLAKQGFSINFSPSQHDDAQRDLLMLQQGRMACYTGFCTVRHSKRTGAGAGAKTGTGADAETNMSANAYDDQRQFLSGAAYGNAIGNRYKLHGLFDADSVAACVRHEYAELERDFCQRVARINELS